MTVGELKSVLEKFPDETPVLYAWSWHSPMTISKGSYLGSAGTEVCCLLDGGHDYGNVVLWEAK